MARGTNAVLMWDRHTIMQPTTKGYVVSVVQSMLQSQSRETMDT